MDYSDQFKQQVYDLQFFNSSIFQKLTSGTVLYVFEFWNSSSKNNIIEFRESRKLQIYYYSIMKFKNC